jgi:hypothetical protein
MKLADQWARSIDSNHGQETEIEVTNWAGRFAYALSGCLAECLANVIIRSLKARYSRKSSLFL